MTAADGPWPTQPVRAVGAGGTVVRTEQDTVDTQVIPRVPATVRRLLAAYADTLDILDGLPMTPMVASRWHWWSRQRSPIRLPRISWMLRSLTLWHIDRVLSEAERAFRRRSAPTRLPAAARQRPPRSTTGPAARAPSGSTYANARRLRASAWHCLALRLVTLPLARPVQRSGPGFGVLTNTPG